MLLLLLCTSVVRATLQAVSQHLEMPNKLPLDPTCSLYHILSVMHETGGSKMDAASPHSQSHLGPWMSPYLQRQPPSDTWADAKVLPQPLAESGTLLSPRECQLKQTPASLLELQCLSKSGWHLKDLGVGWSGLWERRGLFTDFTLAWGSVGQPLRLGLPGKAIAADQPKESEVSQISPP